MRVLRLIGMLGALALMVGEIYRSWGVGRPLAFVLDDMIVGIMMLTAAVLVARPTVARVAPSRRELPRKEHSHVHPRPCREPARQAQQRP